VAQTNREIFERYVAAGPIRRDADAVAELFTEDGVFEAPLLPADHPLPRRLAGRAEIRRGIGAYHRYPAFQGTVDLARSGYVLHDALEPGVFIAEIDTVLLSATGEPGSMSLVQIFRVRDGLIARLRDYFAPS
jgi:ketosteroid isomerase-like protein